MSKIPPRPINLSIKSLITHPSHDFIRLILLKNNGIQQGFGKKHYSKTTKQFYLDIYVNYDIYINTMLYIA